MYIVRCPLWPLNYVMEILFLTGPSYVSSRLIMVCPLLILSLVLIYIFLLMRCLELFNLLV